MVELRDRAADKVGEYSQGMRQRLGIASCLVRKPRLLLLDEPDLGVDPAGVRYLRVWGAQTRSGSCRDAVFVDESAQSCAPTDSSCLMRFD
jgi:ABC-type Na+ transport system ATPase subunit NatA